MLKHIDGSKLNEEIKASSKLVIVDFYATWCGPCQMLAPVLEKVSSSRADCDILEVDIDKSQNTAVEYGIQVVPTLIIFKNGEKLKQLEGYLNENELSEIIEEYV